MCFQQVSHSLFVSVQSTDLFYLWKQEHIIHTKGWLSTYFRFVSEVKNFFWSKLLKQGKDRNLMIGLTAKSQTQKLRKAGGMWRSWAQYLGCRERRRIQASNRSVQTRGDKVHCCAHTEGTPDCSGVHKSLKDKLKTKQNKLLQVFRRFLIAEILRILSVS